MSSSSYHGQTAVKSRARVKPILKKLTQSENNSLDVDRSALDRDGLAIYDFGGRASHDAHASGRRGFHARSTSNTSQFSTTTAGSGHRTGSFVHPFAQQPRPYTPPLGASYANSLHESDDSNHNTNSPHLEDESSRNAFRSVSNISTRTTSLTSVVSPTIGKSQPLLRLQTKQSSSRLPLATSNSSLSNLSYLSPLSPDLTTASETMTPVSTIRTSIDKSFRSRSHSNDMHIRQRSQSLTIVEARKKFNDEVAAKEEAYDRELVRKNEKADLKAARKYEKTHRRSSASDGGRTQRSKSDPLATLNEKGIVSILGDDIVFPTHGEEPEEYTRRSNTYTSQAKHKTHGAWTIFVMWFRTRFIRMGKRTGGG